MSLIYPIGAAVLQAVSFTFDKLSLKVRKMNYQIYNGISFPLIFIFTLIIYFIFRPPFNMEIFEGKYFFILIISIIFIAITNLLYYRALKSDKLSELETLSLLNGIPLILFASLFFSDERNFLVIILAVIAVIAVVWSHWEKHHFKIAKKTWPFFVWILIISPFGGIIVKILLEVWNPITLQLVRDGIIALVFVPLFFKKIINLPSKALPYLLASNLFTSVAWILFFFSIQVIGIIQTILIFSLRPLLVYFSSMFFLKEKFEMKKFVAFMVILIAIGISLLFN